MRKEHGRRVNILAVYLVIDESEAMAASGGVTAINGALPEVHAVLASDPLVSDKCRIGMITFSDTAEELMSLTALVDVVAMPGLEVGGATRLRPALELVRHVIARDSAALAGAGLTIYRPLVLLILGSEPLDGGQWEETHLALVDPRANPNAPHVAPAGTGPGCRHRTTGGRGRR